MNRLILIGMMASALLFSCTYGTKNLNSEIVKNLKGGISTKYDIAELFGPPEDEFINISNEELKKIKFSKISLQCEPIIKPIEKELKKLNLMLDLLDLPKGTYSVWYYYRKFDPEPFWPLLLLLPLPLPQDCQALIVIFNEKNIVEKKIFIEGDQIYW